MGGRACVRANAKSPLPSMHDDRQLELPRALPPRRVCVPSEGDDVVTSPYNAVLGAKQLVAHADSVFPIDTAPHRHPHLIPM